MMFGNLKVINIFYVDNVDNSLKAGENRLFKFNFYFSSRIFDYGQ